MATSGRPLFSIGAVARMLGVSPATIRTWESRYGLVRPERSEGGQRLYSRRQVEQLRFVRQQIDAGRRPGEAHRLLEERLQDGEAVDGTQVRVLLAGSGLDATRVLRELIGAEAFDVIRDACAGDTQFVVIDPGDVSLEEMSARLSASGATLVPVEP